MGVRLRIADNHINGVAVSPPSMGSQHLYYSPLTGLRLWRVETASLRREGMAPVVEEELTNNAVSVWDTQEPWTQTRLVQDNSSLFWPDSMGLGVGDTQLWITTRGWPLDSQPRLVRIHLDME